MSDAALQPLRGEHYPESYVNATDLHTRSRTRLWQRCGRLAPGELAHLEDAVRLYLGL